MSARATTRAPPVSTRLDASSVPRPPQPSSPTRTAELAAVPCTSPGLINIAPAVPAATPINLRRSSLPEEFPRCFTSSDMFPPCAKQIQCVFPARCRFLFRELAARSAAAHSELPDQLLQIRFGTPHVFHLLRA